MDGEPKESPVADDADLTRCMQIIEPLLLDLCEGWEVAVSRYRDEYPPAVLAEHDDSVAAACVRSHQWMEVQRRLDGKPGIALLNINGLKVINLRDQAVIRLKKLDARGRHSNYQTKQQREFDGQEPLPGLPPAAVRLTSGYQLDASGEAIERHIVARPMGRSIAWTAQVHVVDTAASWVDITPRKFAGFERTDFRKRRAGG
jgi:hypothetical protein